MLAFTWEKGNRVSRFLAFNKTELFGDDCGDDLHLTLSPSSAYPDNLIDVHSTATWTRFDLLEQKI